MSVVSKLRTGSWLTADRATAYPRLFLCIVIVVSGFWLATSENYIDRNGKPIGTDFLHHYTTATLVLDGTPELAYDPDTYAAAERKVMQPEDFRFLGSHYPPPALLIIAPVALLSYGLALALWMAGTLALNLLVAKRIAGGLPILLPALAFPGVIINLGHGQNAFLTGALLGGALYLLDRDRPVAAGIMLGLLIYKPQFGLLLPVALLAGRHYKAFIAAAITLLLFLATSWLLLGGDTWQGFFASTEITRKLILEDGAPGWRKLHSFFSLVRGLDGPVSLAYAIQTGVAIVLAILVWRLWRSDTAFNIKAAGLIIASLTATPYLLDYDLVILGLAIIYITVEGRQSGFRDWEISLLALLWVWPLIARSLAGLTSIQFTPLLLATLMYLLVKRDQRLAASLD